MHKIEDLGNGMFEFFFEDTEDLNQIAQQFRLRNLRVEPNQYSESIWRLKTPLN